MWTELFAHLLIGLIGLAFLYLIGVVLYRIYRVIFLKYAYRNAKTVTGIVTDMKYTPARLGMAGNSGVYHPAQNDVYFRTVQKNSHVDSDLLYQRVRIDDEIQVEYQNRYARPRFWSGEWHFDGYRLLTITNPKGRGVVFNKKKPVTRFSN